MTIPAWQLIAWKPVLATLPEFRRALAQMRPLGGPAAGDGDGSDGLRAGAAVRQGQSLWAAAHRGEPLGLAWDWAEVRGTVTRTVDGDEARAHIDALSNKYLGHDYTNPIGPRGRVILEVTPSKVNTPRTMGR